MSQPKSGTWQGRAKRERGIAERSEHMLAFLDRKVLVWAMVDVKAQSKGVR
jgi:hypothetical protein